MTTYCIDLELGNVYKKEKMVWVFFSKIGNFKEPKNGRVVYQNSKCSGE